MRISLRKAKCTARLVKGLAVSWQALNSSDGPRDFLSLISGLRAFAELLVLTRADGKSWELLLVTLKDPSPNCWKLTSTTAVRNDETMAKLDLARAMRGTTVCA